MNRDSGSDVAKHKKHALATRRSHFNQFTRTHGNNIINNSQGVSGGPNGALLRSLSLPYQPHAHSDTHPKRQGEQFCYFFPGPSLGSASVVQSTSPKEKCRPTYAAGV
eukprot:1160306-Pelagomonas_calceolata.AAC.1